jgi:transcription elongation factor GreA
MAIERILLTTAGHIRLTAEHKKLRTVIRPQVVEELATARAHGDLSENAEYHAAKEKLAFVDTRIGYLDDRLTRAEVLDVSASAGDKVLFGATVTLLDFEDDSESRYQLVGEEEADLDHLRISTNSPLARAIMGKEKGDIVELRLPAGARDMEILEVLFVEDPQLV